jgi:hypothetical protein
MQLESYLCRAAYVLQSTDARLIRMSVKHAEGLHRLDVLSDRPIA